jgi:hypothetical protein
MPSKAMMIQKPIVQYPEEELESPKIRVYALKSDDYPKPIVHYPSQCLKAVA